MSGAAPAEPLSEKGRRSRTRLLDSARGVFARDGFAKARIADIAAEAGMSYGAFYHYFDSKESIFRAVAEETEVALLSIHPSGADTDHVERIREANSAYLEAYRRNAGIMRVIEEVSRFDDAVRAVRDRHQDEFAARIDASICRLQKAGLADPRVDGRYAAMALGGMVAAFASALFVHGAPYDAERAVDQLTVLWANALGLPRADGAAR